jgi:predicted acyltransferase (DUF342 family)
MALWLYSLAYRLSDKVNLAGSLEVGRRSEVKGSIRANEVIIGDRAWAEDIHAKNIFVGRTAQARNLYGERITIELGCQVSGGCLL